MSSELVVFAKICPKPEHLEDAKAAILGILGPTRQEPGCRQFRLLSGEGDGRLYLYEEWTNEAALAAHHEQPYTQRVFDSYRNWLAMPVEVTKLRKAA